MNLFEKSKGWLRPRLEAAAGVTVTYTRLAASITLTAVVGRTVFSSNQIEGARVEFGDRDFLIDAAALTFGEPQLGDRITEAGRVFEIVTPGTGEPAWRWSDPQHTAYRIHTKRVS
jgi:hypothetical protein